MTIDWLTLTIAITENKLLGHHRPRLGSTKRKIWREFRSLLELGFVTIDCKKVTSLKRKWKHTINKWNRNAEARELRGRHLNGSHTLKHCGVVSLRALSGLNLKFFQEPRKKYKLRYDEGEEKEPRWQRRQASS
jgi:hypothetical protein